MDNLKYLEKKDLVDKCSDGSINVHDNIKLKNKVQNTLHYISFLEHLLYLCTSKNTNLLKILFNIKQDPNTLDSISLHFNSDISEGDR